MPCTYVCSSLVLFSTKAASKNKFDDMMKNIIAMYHFHCCYLRTLCSRSIDPFIFGRDPCKQAPWIVPTLPSLGMTAGAEPTYCYCMHRMRLKTCFVLLLSPILIFHPLSYSTPYCKIVSLPGQSLVMGGTCSSNNNNNIFTM